MVEYLWSKGWTSKMVSQRPPQKRSQIIHYPFRHGIAETTQDPTRKCQLQNDVCLDQTLGDLGAKIITTSAIVSSVPPVCIYSASLPQFRTEANNVRHKTRRLQGVSARGFALAALIGSLSEHSRVRDFTCFRCILRHCHPSTKFWLTLTMDSRTHLLHRDKLYAQQIMINVNTSLGS
jgi:hypothetical protein